MEEIAIKRECTEFGLFCGVCLSFGRKLMPLGIYTDVYRKLMADFNYQDKQQTEDMQLCWECHALLGKAVKFTRQVKKAYEVLRLGENYIYGTLSSLTTIIMNDHHPNTILINEQNKRDFTKEEPLDETHIKTDLQESNENAKKDCLDTDITSDLEKETILEIDGQEKDCILTENKKEKSKPQTISKWKEKKQKQNRKPKFKIVLSENSNHLIRKAKMSVAGLLTRLDSEKNKRFEFKKFKCVSCVKSFKNEVVMLRHNQNYHNKDKSMHVCDICSSGFEEKNKLQSHIQSHFIKYICDICRFSSQRRKEVNKHINEKHMKWFQCLNCGVKCRKSCLVRIHTCILFPPKNPTIK